LTKISTTPGWCISCYEKWAVSLRTFFSGIRVKTCLHRATAVTNANSTANALNEDIRPPDDFTIVPAVTQQALADWRDVFTAAFDMPAAGGQAWVEATLQADLENAPWQLYVGYLADEPVASSMLFNGAGVVGVYSIGVLPEARRQGLGAAITLQPLLEARERGYQYAVLFSSKIAYPVYQRLGFREVNCKIGIYILEKD
jgi:ribosomal protein S18 acetylase RimI-like enzyme